MTNKDKFLKDGVSVEEFIEFLKSKQPNNKYDMTFHDIVLWLNEQVKPTLTEDERVILRNVQSRAFSSYRVIGKDNHNQLYLADTSKAIDKFYGFGQYFGHLFQFIKERRRIFY